MAGPGHAADSSPLEIPLHKLASAFSVLFFACVGVSAAPVTAESVERLMSLTRAESIVDSMYGGMEQAMRQSMQQAAGQRTLTAEQQRVLDRIPGKFIAVMKEEFNWATMKNAYVRIYQETFQQEEIDGLIAFYESPVGQATIAKMPEVMQRSMAVAQERAQTLLPKMTRMIEDAMKEASDTR